ncbi:hypothetical protein BYT27DRAFT_7326490 [Phlegmacium glaucopus]|nr:hypothetical protein BYT27DRAFT_7326490 [Phlegmacium glaucopus]
MYNADSKTELESYIEKIFSYIEKYNIEIPEETCLVLELRNSGKYGHYFVNHAKQCLFWLDEINGRTRSFLGKVRVKHTPSLLGESPNEIFVLDPLSSSAISEIKDILIHAVGNSLTSSRGLAPYSLEDLQKMLVLVNTIEVPSLSLLELKSNESLDHERFLHLHGQINARLTRGQSIHPERHGILLELAIACFLLGVPRVHLRKLREITTDCLVNDFVWKDLLGQLTAGWRELTLYATVLLSANVAFLAIQTVGTSVSDSSYTPSFVETLTYFSMAASFLVIVLSLVLVKTFDNLSLDAGVTFIVDRSASRFGLEALASAYSLPYALLMYS